MFLTNSVSIEIIFSSRQELINFLKELSQLMSLDYFDLFDDIDGIIDIKPISSGGITFIMGGHNESILASEKLKKHKFFEFYNDDTMKNALIIPNFSLHGFTSACKNLSCSQKWAMYMRFFLLTENNKTNLKSSYLYQSDTK